MLKVDRNRVKRPAEFDTVKSSAAWRAGEEFYSLPLPKRLQRRFNERIPTMLSKNVRAAVFGLFDGRCAYCEQPLGESGTIDLFRPRAQARSIDGKTSADHYWWLAFEWENYYASCAICHSVKATRFPVVGRRISIGEDPSREKAVLIDPCCDNPAEHFAYTRDGVMYGVSDRGSVTIEILRLNRPELRRSRGENIKKGDEVLRRLWSVVRQLKSQESRDRSSIANDFNALRSSVPYFPGMIVSIIQSLEPEWSVDSDLGYQETINHRRLTELLKSSRESRFSSRPMIRSRCADSVRGRSSCFAPRTAGLHPRSYKFRRIPCVPISY